MLARPGRTLATVGLVVTGLAGLSRPASAQIMIRGFGGFTQTTCSPDFTTGGEKREILEGWAIDVRVGRYQKRTVYLTAGIVSYFNVWWQE